MRRTETPKPIWIKFCVVVDIADVVTYTNFGDHRLRGFWVAGGQISPSRIDFHRRPYNTLALPCERVTFNCKRDAVSSRVVISTVLVACCTLERVTVVHHIISDDKNSSLCDGSTVHVCPLIRRLWVAFC